MNRRDFFDNVAKAALFQVAKARLPMSGEAVSANVKADISLRIESTSLDIGPGVSIRTVTYNGQVPGPTLRLKAGIPVTIDITNATFNEEIVHWHWLAIRTIPDGAVEEGSPNIKSGKKLRYSFTPKPAATRWYHPYAMAMDDLSLAGYTGQFGFLLVEGKKPKPHYDQPASMTARIRTFRALGWVAARAIPRVTSRMIQNPALMIEFDLAALKDQLSEMRRARCTRGFMPETEIRAISAASRCPTEPANRTSDCSQLTRYALRK